MVNKVIERSTAYSNNLFVIEAGRADTIDRIKAQAYNIMHEFRSGDITIFFDYLQKIPFNGSTKTFDPRSTRHPHNSRT